MKAICSTSTIKGHRGENQDRFCVDDIIVSFDSPQIACEADLPLSETDRHIIAVADGVTNSTEGGRCAELTVKTISEFYKKGYFDKEISKERFDHLMETAARAIRWEFKDYDYTSGSTTISIVVFDKKNVWCYNLGDSPIYLIRDGAFIPMFREDTLGAEKERENNEKGLLNRLLNKNPPSQQAFNCLTKCVSSRAYTFDGFVTSADFQEKDILLIASDGLFKSVPQNEIMSLIEESAGADKLTQKAEKYHASDDTTVALIRKEGNKNGHIFFPNED